jgi:competence protein ComEA
MMLLTLKITLLIVICASGCTSRQVYVAANAAPASANAININTASAAELETLPRIGPKTAALIVKFREDNGPFRRVEHLMQIRGISEKRFNEIRPFIRTE